MSKLIYKLYNSKMKFKVQINGQQKPITAKNPKIDQNKDNICWIPYS